MTVDVEHVLRRDGTRVGEFIDAAPIPAFSVSTVRTGLVRGHGRMLPVAVMSALALAATLVVVVVVSWDGDRSIVPAAPLPTVDSSVPVSSPPSTPPIVPAVSTPPTEEAASSATVPAFGAALQSDQLAGPAAFSVIPDAFRPVLVQTSPADASAATVAPVASQGWSATFIRRPTNDNEVAAYVVVLIEDITNGDPYCCYPGTLTSPDVTIGQFIGRVEPQGPGYLSFIAQVNDTQRVLVGGRTTIDDIRTITEGLELRPDGIGADATLVPEGYELVDQGSRARPPWTAEWAVSYARDQLSQSQITIRSRLNPRDPALMSLMSPTGATIVDINGFEGVINETGVTFDISPTFQIEIQRDWLESNTSVTDEQLIDLARTVVAINDTELAELADQATAQPLIATDLPCSFYIRGVNPRTDPPQLADEHGYLVVAPGATVTVDLTTSQPLGRITVGLNTIGWDGQPPATIDTSGVVVAELDKLTGTETVELSWDGTINGQPALPGNYSLTIEAEPHDPAATTICSAGTGSGTLQVAYRVN